ncbi:MAG: hypothetical protein K0U74_13510 [Alphaproteobacteria bacterium]|nr:hypothetical protein [Alphaproteobacteria bacterium]
MLQALLPLAALSLLTAAAVLPWPGDGSGLMAAMLPVFAVHYWALRRPEGLPGIAVVFSGLTVDLLTGGPLGFWTSIYAGAWIFGSLEKPWAFSAGKIGRWGLFAVAAGGVALLAIVMGALLDWPVASVASLIGAWFWLVALYVPISLLLRLLDAGWEREAVLE